MSRQTITRPEELYALFEEVASLKGVGVAMERALAKTCKMPEGMNARLKDLAMQLPRNIMRRKKITRASTADKDDVVILKLRIGLHVPPPPRTRLPYRINAMDEAGELVHLVWFKTDRRYMQTLAPEGEVRLVSGKLESNRGVLTIAHPEFVVTEDKAWEIPETESIYPLTSGISNKVMRKLISQMLEKLPELPEWIEPSLLRKEGWDNWQGSVRSAHNAVTEADILPLSPARSRLAYDELLAHYLALLILRSFMKKKPGQALKGDGSLTDGLIKSLPFELTASQRQAYAEIAADMGSPTMMMRMLQGDVGSGKTIVALLALLIAVESGGQAALMAPTEILAQQHFDTLNKFLQGTNVRVDFLSGKHKGKVRKEILQNLKGGVTKILIGTHALFQSDVEYADLKLAVIDEQHRFGVQQRMALLNKGKETDLLAMTATPIPRSLEMIAHGDLDTSRLTEKPSGFQPVHTSLVPLTRLQDVFERLQKPLEAGEQIYWVCPLVEESENSDLAAAELRHAELMKIYGDDKVGLVHGRMKAKEKEAVMQRFKAGEIKILIATTVIEVGIDVAAAQVMIVEHAERFGLAQLHQLRGRVGRSDNQSHCILLYDTHTAGVAKERLQVLRQSHDGFVIAEKDLALRGAGEVLGVRQSGMPNFRLADLDIHRELSNAAQKQAQMIIAKDYKLQDADSYPYRVLLHLFESSSAMAYLRS